MPRCRRFQIHGNGAYSRMSKQVKPVPDAPVCKNLPSRKNLSRKKSSNPLKLSPKMRLMHPIFTPLKFRFSTLHKNRKNSPFATTQNKTFLHKAVIIYTLTVFNINHLSSFQLSS